ncbi:cell division protein SepF [Atopobium fossor]|uniref:cell division protein SepF n=1 Tax=Atopobium fossor TaxID=39487 RepID=UPI0003F56F23|nr:cell division protein SepF [Atopobium fossor]
MSFLDTIKDKLRLEPQEEYYDDIYDEQDYDDTPDAYDQPRYDQSRDVAGAASNGLLGNTPRPEADSVSVYTRSGRPLGGNGGSAGATTYTRDEEYEVASRPSYARSTPISERAAAIPRSGSQLPAYVLTPQSYDDCQTVVRRVRTNQPVVLSFRNTNVDAAKRIFDFCAGLACGVGGQIQELGTQCFVVLPAGKELSQNEVDKLIADGTIVRKD